MNIDLIQEQARPLKTTFVTFVLDQTQSMQRAFRPTINGFNEYLQGLTDPKYGRVEFSLVKFNSLGIEKPYVGARVAEVSPLNELSYRPAGMTPLIDAAYEAIRATERAVIGRELNVLVVIQTDGEENSSTRHSLVALRELIMQKQNEGWVFVFLGAGIDTFSAAASFGIHNQFATSYALHNTAETFADLRNKTAAFRASGAAASMSYTAEDRERLNRDAN